MRHNNSRLSRLWFAAKVVPLLIGMFWLSVDGMAQNNCNQIQTMVRSSPNADQPIVVSMMELRSNAAMYYGKTVTVDGELPIVASSTRKRHGVSIRPPFAEFPGCGEVG